MKQVDIIIPVKNEEHNLEQLVARINQAMVSAKLFYRMIFVDDKSTDKTVEVLNSLKNRYPIKIYSKLGKVGKAYSILEGVKYSTSEYVAMLDADLQYPPEAIPEMFEKAQGHGVIVANRKDYEASKLRKFVSKTFSFGFGRLLHGFKVDVQSGLKLFRREILSFVEEKDISPWTLDLSLLKTARELGFKIGSVDITFDKRTTGQSKVNLIKTSIEIGKNALKLKFKKPKIHNIKPAIKGTMVGAGIVHNRKWLRTHTTLKAEHSAIKTFNSKQISGILLLVLALEVGLILNPIMTLIGVVGVLSFIYFIDVLFNLYVVLKSLHFPPEISFTPEEIARVSDAELPIYTILCPLYKEAHILPHFLKAIEMLDWPKNKLDVKLLLEEDDKESIEAVKGMALPKYVSTVIVPDSQPKTKPKACNYGLNFATGEYLVIYDAEDLPEFDQLKKAYLAFKKSSPNVVCLQAKLNYYNHNQNLLTRFFTAEYSLWFEVMLTGLQSIDTVIPLGGTSNHFKTKALLELEGWDPFNVTEDCDLGIRLFKKGYKTSIIDSTTWEEANSNPGNWLRQRSRWIKGYMQTYLVHMRNPFTFIKTHGLHSFIFQLIIGARISFMLINPILWATTFAYFAFYQYTSTFIESIFPNTVFYFAVISLIFGNFLYLFNYMIGCAKKGHWTLIKYVYLIPFYWLMASTAAMIALYQLIVKPHYWEKTVHGLHLAKKKIIEEVKENAPEIVVQAAEVVPQVIEEKALPEKTPGRLSRKIKEIFGEKRILAGGLVLVGATVITNFLNFVYNSYLGRSLTVEEFGIISLFGSFLFIATIPIFSLGGLITQKTAFLLGQSSKAEATANFKKIYKSALAYSLVVTLIWLLMTPFLSTFFQVESYIPFLIFAPVWSLGVLVYGLQSYMNGLLQFSRIAFLVIVSSVFKLVLAFMLIDLQLEDWVLLSIPLSFLIDVIFCFLIVDRDFYKASGDVKTSFDWKFFTSSFMTGISTFSFLAFDVLLAKHFLSPVEAGQYGLLSLVGKITFFLTSLLSPFMLPLVSVNRGAKRSSKSTFILLFGFTLTIAAFSFAAFNIFGSVTVPLLLGSNAAAILEILPIYSLAIILFSITKPVVSFFQAKEEHSYVLAGFLVTILQLVLTFFFHKDLWEFVYVMFAVSFLNLITVVGIYLLKKRFSVQLSNIQDLFGLFSFRSKVNKENPLVKKILIFNWRDTKHVWAGGAEAYIHELAKRWVKDGHKVTVFCGNDGHNPRNEVIDGVQIVRRGGFYTVYIWAFLYYILRFRGLFDAVIDSENGIPFFTPLFVKVPKFLLIHHVHQEVFRQHLPFGLSHFARFLEGKVMPLVYKNQKIITVSESSKAEILKIKLGSQDSISVVHPGVELKTFFHRKKTDNPSVLYLGRLQPYKNIDIAIKAFAEVVKVSPQAVFTIAGFGESLNSLKKLAVQLNIEDKINFLGKVSEEEKRELYAKHWLMVQPSMLEGWGITVIEANASGTPVIASRVKGLSDSIVDQKTGILVEPKSIKDFSAAMIRLIQNKKFRKKLSANAYIWSKNFEWEKSSKDFYSTIEQVLNTFYGKVFGNLAVSKIN